MLNFASAYNQLTGYEREFVDDFLRSVEREAERRFERLTTTLQRISATIDLDTIDSRTRQLLTKPIITAAIRERTEQLAAERDLTPDRIIREHAAIGLFNLQKFFPTVDEDGVPQFNATNATAADWTALQAVDIEETYSQRGTVRKIKIKAHSKQTSLDAIAAFMGLNKGDSPEYAAYRTMPADLVQLPNSATVSAVAEQYAKFIDG